MTPPPGSSDDLDALVDDALAENTFNTRFPPLLAVVLIHRRLDLAERLFSAGATMTADDFSRVIYWWCPADIIAFILENNIPHDAGCLEMALRHDQWETIFLLLDYGAKVNTVFREATFYNNGTLSLLHMAAWYGNSAAVRRLLQKGAEVDCRDFEATTPLMRACDTNHASHKHTAGADSVYWLLKHGADVNAQNSYGETPLLLCTSTKQEAHRFFYHRTQTAQTLLHFGANPDAVVPAFGTTALMFAARDNDAHLIRSLLRAGANPSLKTPDGRTARDVAKQRGHKEVYALLR